MSNPIDRRSANAPLVWEIPVVSGPNGRRHLKVQISMDADGDPAVEVVPPQGEAFTLLVASDGPLCEAISSARQIVNQMGVW